MRTTIELPDPLFKRAKACAAMRGIKLRRLFAEALQRYVVETEDGSSLERPGTGVPVVRAEDLADCKDPAALRAAYPRGYRIVGPLLRAGDGAKPLTAAQVAEAEQAMDREEMNKDALPG